MNARQWFIDASVIEPVIPHIRATIERYLADVPSPSVAWGLVVDGTLLASGSEGTRRKVGVDTPFRIASMTKSFSAATALALRDEGVFSLDDEVGKLAPPLAVLRGPTADAAPIRVRDLLSMSSGLVTDDPWADRHLDLTVAEFTKIVEAGPVFALPTGGGFQYSNFGFAVLGQMVEHLTGVRFQDHVTERIIAPLGLDHTGWNQPSGDDWARPYRVQDGEFVAESAPLADGVIAPMGGLWSTMSDLATWVGWLGAAYPARDDPDDNILRRSSRREMQTAQQWATPLVRDGVTIPGCYGYGLRTLYHPDLGTIVTHSGGLPGYGSNMGWLLSRRVGFVAAGNTTYAPMTGLTLTVLEALGEVLNLLPPASTVPLGSGAGRLDVLGRRLVSLLNDWSDHDAELLFADNVQPDESWERRRSHAAQWAPLTVDRVEPLSEASANVICHSDDGSVVQVMFVLSVPSPQRIQKYTIST